MPELDNSRTFPECKDYKEKGLTETTCVYSFCLRKSHNIQLEIFHPFSDSDCIKEINISNTEMSVLNILKRNLALFSQ